MYTPKRKVSSSRTEDSSLLRKSVSSPFRTLNTSVTNNETEDSFNQSAAFQVLKRDNEFELHSYGNVLPVEVTKAFSSDSSVSSNILSNGWAVVVSNKKIYAWRYTLAFLKKMVSCFVLQLPSTELSHSALLTCILQNEDSSGAAINARTSVINISPQGDIRYWPNVARASSFVDFHIDLKGKQCHQLLSLMPYGCVMVTTTKEMFLLTPSQTTVLCQEISLSTGMFSGFSRRVSSFWGPEENVMTVSPCLCDGTLDYLQAERYFFVGTKSTIQKWQLTGTRSTDTKMLCELNMLKLIKAVENCPFDSSSDDLQVLDIKNAGFALLVLLAIWKDESIYECYLAVLKIHSQDTSTIESLKYLDYNFVDCNVDDIHLESPTGSYRAYVYTPNAILTIPVLGHNDDLFTIPFTENNNILIGAGCYGGDIIFLNKKHGLISVTIHQYQTSLIDESFPKIDQANQSMDQTNTSNLMLNSKHETNPSTFLRQAFLQYSKTNKNISSIKEFQKTNGSNIFELVKNLSEEIINSSPATDTTWANADTTLESSSSLLINQLTDKLKTFEMFQIFLDNHNVFNMGSTLTNKLHSMVCEHGEKLQLCMTLLQMYPEHEELLNNIIDGDFNESSHKIQEKDKLFTQISNIGHLFMLLVSHEKENIKETTNINNQVQIISAVSALLLNCFRSAWEYRQNYFQKYQLSENIAIPWTGSSFGDNNREMLKIQIGIILKQALPHVDSVKTGSFLCQCVVVLADVLLDGFQRELNLEGSSLDQYTYDSINEDFCYNRENICHTLVNMNYNEPSLTLAEKYEDFSLMIAICEKTNKPEKIEEYKQLYQNQGFNDVLYNYYMEKGAWGKLMSLENTSRDYEQFLRNHGNLSWIHFLGSKEFSKASHVLKSLASNEEAEIERKKMMLILSNLSMLASSESQSLIESSIAENDHELEIIEYQNNIMKALHRDENVPLKPEELLEICIAEDENVHEDKFYIYLLELLLYVDSESEVLHEAVWKKILDADRWDEQSMIDYSVLLKQRVVYKCLQYISQKDCFVNLLAILKNLITSDTSSISETCRSHVKACWELIDTSDQMVTT